MFLGVDIYFTLMYNVIYIQLDIILLVLCIIHLSIVVTYIQPLYRVSKESLTLILNEIFIDTHRIISQGNLDTKNPSLLK